MYACVTYSHFVIMSVAFSLLLFAFCFAVLYILSQSEIIMTQPPAACASRSFSAEEPETPSEHWPACDS